MSQLALLHPANSNLCWMTSMEAWQQAANLAEGDMAAFALMEQESPAAEAEIVTEQDASC